MTLSHLKPTVPKCWLFATSGVMWSAVGIMMCFTAIGWLADRGVGWGMAFALAGLILAMLSVRWGFDGIAQKKYPAPAASAGSGLLFCVPGVEELFDHSGHDCPGGCPAALIGPETIPGGRLHSHWRRPDRGQFLLLSAPVEADSNRIPPAYAASYPALTAVNRMSATIFLCPRFARLAHNPWFRSG